MLDLRPERSRDIAGLDPTTRIVATVNTTAILEEEVNAVGHQAMFAAQRLPEPQRTVKLNEAWKEALDTLIERELILQDAEEKLNARGNYYLDRIKETAVKEFDKNIERSIQANPNIKTREEFVKMLEQQGTSIGALQRQFERQFIATEYLKSRVFPQIDRIHHPEIRAYYEKNQKEFMVPDKVVWQDLFINASAHPTRGTARQFAAVLVQRIRQGENFKKLADQYDNGFAKFQPNALGVGTKRGEIQPLEVESALFKLRAGETSDPIEVTSGFHIVRVVEREYAGLRPFNEEVQREIRAHLRSRIADREQKRVIEELRSRAVIEYSSEK